jgi:DNA-directed RNA polymerase specialized sigma24 family protein
MQAALKRTPPPRRDTYLMVAEGEMSYAAVAAELNIPLRTVETRVRRTRVELRETMAEYRREGTRSRSVYSQGGEK